MLTRNRNLITLIILLALVPVYADFGKGWNKLGMATMIGNSSIDVSDIKLPSAPKRVAICALNDVLAASIQNGK